MNAHIRASEIALFLSDIEDEFAPARLDFYTAEVRDLLPDSASADLELASQQLALAQASIRKAASRLGYASLIEGLRL